MNSLTRMLYSKKIVPYPGRTIRQGNGRFRAIPEYSWKQYSAQELSGFFRRLPSHILPETSGNTTGKIQRLRLQSHLKASERKREDKVWSPTDFFPSISRKVPHIMFLTIPLNS